MLQRLFFLLFVLLLVLPIVLESTSESFMDSDSDSGPWLGRARDALKNMFDPLRPSDQKGISWHAGRFQHLSLFDKDMIWRVLTRCLHESEAKLLYPKTYYLPQDLPKINRLNSDTGFILKKTHSFARKGLLVVDTPEAVHKHAKGYDICQVLIPNPDLINGYKYDLRMFLVVHHQHGIMLYHDGYFSYSNYPYDPQGKNMFSRIGGVHLTPSFYIDNRLPTRTSGHSKYPALYEKIVHMLKKVFRCYPQPLLGDEERNGGLIKIFGIDINIFNDRDGQLRPMLIEMNNNPCLLFPEADWKNKLIYELVQGIKDNKLDKFSIIREN